MFRNVHNPSGSSPRARNPAARRRTVFIALVFALVIGGAGQPVLAQGDGPSWLTHLDIAMVSRQVKPQTICVGDEVNIAVDVFKKLEIVDILMPRKWGKIAVKVQASVMDSGIGKINPPSNSTRLEDSAYFTFSAEKPGTTRIQFSGKVNTLEFLGLVIISDEVHTHLTVTVEECEYKIRAVTLFQAQGARVWAFMEGALKRESDGRFIGEGNVEWIGSNFSGAGGCSGPVNVASPSQVELTAERVDDELTVDLAYLPVVFTATFNCPGVPPRPIEEWLGPDAITFTVPASGEQDFKAEQDLYEPNYFQFQGEVYIGVTRVIK